MFIISHHSLNFPKYNYLLQQTHTDNGTTMVTKVQTEETEGSLPSNPFPPEVWWQWKYDDGCRRGCTGQVRHIIVSHVLKINGYDDLFYCRNHTCMFDNCKIVLRPTPAHRPRWSTTLSSFEMWGCGSFWLGSRLTSTQALHVFSSLWSSERKIQFLSFSISSAPL